MKKSFKLSIYFALVVLIVCSALAFTSCEVDVESDVEEVFDDVMLADSYTVDISFDDGSSYHCEVDDGNFYSLADVDGIETKTYIYKNENGEYFKLMKMI